MTNSKNSCCAPRGRSFPGREMDELFDRLFSPTNAGNATRKWVAPSAIWEEGEDYHIEVELPGVKREALGLTLEDGQLSITAQRDEPTGDRKYLHNERRTGEMTRVITVPDFVDPDSISADYADGLLHIVLSKRPEVLPKKIDINVQ